MRVSWLSLPIMSLVALPALAAPGDQWILPVHHTLGPINTYPGIGYQGGNAYGRDGFDGEARIFWELSGNSINSNTPFPTTTQLYSFEYFGPTTGPSSNTYHVVEVDFNGSAEGTGEAQVDPLIPWAGQFGQNHQWIKAEGGMDGQWHTLGPGPQSPASNSYNAAGNGFYMWAKADSWLYAKWNLPFTVNRRWSALRLTQITPLPGPPPEGDYNKNGTVDAADYVLWAIGDPAADGVDDEIVDEYDYYYWQERFGNTNQNGAASGSPSMGAVPEPTTLLLLALAGAACIATFRRRGRPEICR